MYRVFQSSFWSPCLIIQLICSSCMPTRCHIHAFQWAMRRTTEASLRRPSVPIIDLDNFRYSISFSTMILSLATRSSLRTFMSRNILRIRTSRLALWRLEEFCEPSSYWSGFSQIVICSIGKQLKKSSQNHIFKYYTNMRLRSRISWPRI